MVFSTIDVPGAMYTEAYGINDAGEITGIYADSHGASHGFLYFDGSFETLDIGTSLTEPRGINDEGDVVGNAADINDFGFLATPVPEPGSVTIFGAALAGIGLVRRRKRTSASLSTRA